MQFTIKSTASVLEDRAMAVAFLEDMEHFTSLRQDQEEARLLEDESVYLSNLPVAPTKLEVL